MSPRRRGWQLLGSSLFDLGSLGFDLLNDVLDHLVVGHFVALFAAEINGCPVSLAM